MVIPEILSLITDQFGLHSDPTKIMRWGGGHIHETYLVETEFHNPDYILQKINSAIFKDIPGMMNNIDAVSRHIGRKRKEAADQISGYQSLTLVNTISGNKYFIDTDGSYWRMYVFIPDTVTYQKLVDPDIGYEAGKAIGRFQTLLSGLTVPLVVTIPDFHNIHFRIKQYLDAKENDMAGRKDLIAGDLQFAEIRFGLMKTYYQSLKDTAIVRTTHNDTKLNNILFDKNNRAICLIDLDTVMPGYVHFDYGDALRTMANTALEDEKDLSLVTFNRLVYNSFTKGYLEETAGMLTVSELALLPYAPVYLTFMIGLRFLTDYLNGDVYFRIQRPEHNLDRVRVQFKLVGEMEQSLHF